MQYGEGCDITKIMNIPMDNENFDFLSQLNKEQKSDLSKAVRDMVTVF